MTSRNDLPQKLEVRYELNNCYLPIFKNATTDCRYLLMFGSRGSGKSQYKVAQHSIWETLNLPYSRIVMCRKVYRDIKDSVFQELKEFIEEQNLSAYFKVTSSPYHIECTLNNNRIIFRGLDDASKLKSLKNPTKFIIDEADQVSEQDLRKIDGSLRTKQASYLQIALLLNTSTKSHWIYKRFISGKNYRRGVLKKYSSEVTVNGKVEKVKVALLHTTYKENRFLPTSYIAYLESLKYLGDNETTYKLDALGEWVEAIKGIIFQESNHWERINVVQPKKETIAGLDWGYNDPSAIVQIEVDGSELQIDEVLFARHRTANDIADYLDEINFDKTIPIYCDSSRPDDIEIIYRRGYNAIPSIKGKDSILQGIRLMKRYKMKVTRSSVNVIKELERYTWKVDKQGNSLEVPIDNYNHSIDAIRYAIFTHLQNRVIETGEQIRGYYPTFNPSKHIGTASWSDSQIILSVKLNSNGYCNLLMSQFYQNQIAHLGEMVTNSVAELVANIGNELDLSQHYQVLIYSEKTSEDARRALYAQAKGFKTQLQQIGMNGLQFKYVEMNVTQQLRVKTWSNQLYQGQHQKRFGVSVDRNCMNLIRDKRLLMIDEKGMKKRDKQGNLGNMSDCEDMVLLKVLK